MRCDYLEGTMWETLGYVVFALGMVACLSFIGTSLNDESGRD